MKTYLQQPKTPNNMNLNSLIALLTAILPAISAIISPAIQQFIQHNPVVSAIYMVAVAVYNNLVTPVHKP